MNIWHFDFFFFFASNDFISFDYRGFAAAASVSTAGAVCAHVCSFDRQSTRRHFICSLVRLFVRSFRHAQPPPLMPEIPRDSLVHHNNPFQHSLSFSLCVSFPVLLFSLPACLPACCLSCLSIHPSVRLFVRLLLYALPCATFCFDVRPTIRLSVRPSHFDLCAQRSIPILICDLVFGMRCF